MSNPALGLTMLGLIIVVIMLGFPTAFTLMGLGMMFGFMAFYDPAIPWYDNRIFDLMVQRAFGAMTNETLLSIPLFVLMGYVMERGALVDRMFNSVRLAFRGVPGSLAVTTLIICTFWGIASGLVGAVVVLMGVIAMRPMLNAGYDVRMASGVITAGGTLGILIPPSVNHRLCRGGRAVRGQTLRGRDVSRFFPGVLVSGLRDRLGNDRPEGGAQAADRANARADIALGCTSFDGLFIADAADAPDRSGVARTSAAGRWQGVANHLAAFGVGPLPSPRSRLAGGSLPRGHLVVCRHPCTGGGRTGCGCRVPNSES